MNCKYASTCTRRYAPTCILLYLAKWYWRMQVGAYLPCWCVFAGRLVRICHVGAYSPCWCVISQVGSYILNVASYILNVEYLVIWRSIADWLGCMVWVCTLSLRPCSYTLSTETALCLTTARVRILARACEKVASDFVVWRWFSPGIVWCPLSFVTG